MSDAVDKQLGFIANRKIGSAYSGWSAEDDSLLRLMSKQPIEAIAQHFGRSKGAVQSRMRKLGLL